MADKKEEEDRINKKKVGASKPHYRLCSQNMQRLVMAKRALQIQILGYHH